MPPVSDGDPGPDRYRRAQRGLTRLLLRDLRRLRGLLRGPRLEDAVAGWIDAAQAVIEQYGETSASLAADFYETQRDAAGVVSPFRAELAPPPPREQSSASLRWASRDVWPRDGQTLTLGARLDDAQGLGESVAQKLVADQGRETVRRAVRADRDAVAYARAAALGACSFCKLMSSRGAVYATADTAGRVADERFTGDASVVKFHDNCHCAIIPVFRGQRFELSSHAAEWDRLYQEYAAGHPGDQLRLFRRALREHDSSPLPAAH